MTIKSIKMSKHQLFLAFFWSLCFNSGRLHINPSSLNQLIEGVFDPPTKLICWMFESLMISIIIFIKQKMHSSHAFLTTLDWEIDMKIWLSLLINNISYNIQKYNNLILYNLRFSDSKCCTGLIYSWSK